jgi:hypothetical protein
LPVPAFWRHCLDDFIENVCHALFAFEKPPWHYRPHLSPPVGPGTATPLVADLIFDWAIWVDSDGVVEGARTEGIGRGF